MKRCMNASLLYAILAMVGGVFYREFTKFNGFTAGTTLGVVHTHYFLLGMVFFLLLRPDWLPRWVYWGVLALGAALALGEMALDYRRRRPRRRWRDAGLVLLSLSVVWIVILPPFFFWGVSGEKELTRATLGLGVAALVACVVCLLRWRRLRAEAEMRLWKLNAERRRRDMLCARAAAEGGGR